MRSISSTYFGSVRFFKHLILVVIIILIAVPTLLAVRAHTAMRTQRDEIARLRGDLLEMREAQAILAENSTPPSLDQAAEPIGYQLLYPDFYAPSPYLAQEWKSNTIYLTFDDGPSVNTEKILAILTEKNVKATFYVTACTDEADFRALRAIADQGHAIGMHSYSHNYATIYASVEAFLDDMYQVFTQIKETTGVAPTLFRFPGGTINAYNAGIYQELVAEMMRRGFVPCDWNLSAEDGVKPLPSVDRVLINVVDGARQRGIERGFVLMHDSVHTTTTVSALGSMIDQFRDMGYGFECITPATKPILFGYKDYE